MQRRAAREESTEFFFEIKDYLFYVQKERTIKTNTILKCGNEEFNVALRRKHVLSK
jgi:hypothetical protein